MITTELLTEIIRQGAENHTRVVEGLPADARLVRIIPEFFVNDEILPTRLALVYESAEWPEALEGYALPIQIIVFETIRGQ